MVETKCGFNDVPDGVSGSNLLAAFGPTILVDIGFDPNFKSNPPGQIPVPSIKGLSALVDTGASLSCIDSQLAANLNLPIIDRLPMAGIHGAREVNMHLAQVHVPSLNYTIYGAFAGVGLAAGGQQHHALIGRNFLQQFTMVYHGQTGTVTLSDQ